MLLCFFTILASFMNVVHVISFYAHINTHTLFTRLVFDLIIKHKSKTQTVRWKIKLLCIKFDNKWIIDIIHYFWKILSELRIRYISVKKLTTRLRLACFERKKMLRFLSNQRLTILLCCYLKVNFSFYLFIISWQINISPIHIWFHSKKV